MAQNSAYSFLTLLHALMGHLMGTAQAPGQDQPVEGYAPPGKTPNPSIDMEMEVQPYNKTKDNPETMPRTYGHPEDIFDQRFNEMQQALLKVLGNGTKRST